MRLQLLLGVYEFDPSTDNCNPWCDTARTQQVSTAIASFNKYNANGDNCILGVVVGHDGLLAVRKIPGFYDKPLKGDRKGQRSIRLSKAYRTIYVIGNNGNIKIAEIIEVQNAA
ncbi:hypothetical protein [Legionella sp.]|uniref:hypothetical protein n=1 Tax=Legionella sp. TaxID=459 RepID=UPI003CBAAE44